MEKWENKAPKAPDTNKKATTDNSKRSRNRKRCNSTKTPMYNEKSGETPWSQREELK